MSLVFTTHIHTHAHTHTHTHTHTLTHSHTQLLLLGEGGSINIADNHGNTPLHLACSNGHEEVQVICALRAQDSLLMASLSSSERSLKLH